MERQLDAYAASLLRRSLESARGASSSSSACADHAVEAGSGPPALRFADGTVIARRLGVMTTGVTPNAALAKEAGLQCGRGILVDDTLQTYDPRVYAVGECVQHRNATYGLVRRLGAGAGPAPPTWPASATALHRLGGSRPRSRSPASSVLSRNFAARGLRGADTCATRKPASTRRIALLKDNRVSAPCSTAYARDARWYLS